MKKALIVFFSCTLISFTAAATIKERVKNGDPVKKDEKSSSFGLAQGYFSFFSLFSPAPIQSDTLRSREVPKVIKSGATKNN